MIRRPCDRCAPTRRRCSALESFLGVLRQARRQEPPQACPPRRRSTYSEFQDQYSVAEALETFTEVPLSNKGLSEGMAVKRHCHWSCAATRVAPWPIHPWYSRMPEVSTNIASETACPNDALRFGLSSVIMVAWVVSSVIHCKPTSSSTSPAPFIAIVNSSFLCPQLHFLTSLILCLRP